MFNFIKKYINKNEIINDSTLLFYDKKDILNLNFKNDNFNNNNLHYFEVINEYLNFYLDLFQLNYPIVFNKLNFMDNYNKINLKLDVVFNIKQSNKKLNKKINI